MANKLVAFRLTNTQEDYVQCLRIITRIEKKEIKNIEASQEKWIHVFSSGRQWTSDDIKNMIEGKSAFATCDVSELESDEPIHYHFDVKCEDENDITNLLYYCLICDSVEQSDRACSLCVECNYKQSANIRDFLTWLLNAGTIKNCYTYINKECRKINADRIYELKHALQNNPSKKRTDGVRIMRQFSPIFRIDEKCTEGAYGSVTYWRQPMRTFLYNLYYSMHENNEKIPIKTGARPNIRYRVNYFLPHVCPSNLRTKYPGEEWQKVTCPREQHLLSNFIECFCSVDKEQTKQDNLDFIQFSEERYQLWKSKELFDQIQEMPVLAMYIFCISDYFLRDNSSAEQLEQKIYDARDMADGLLQILENIYHSEKGRGYFCFRVHTNVEDRSKRYLEQKYKAYMESWNERTDAPKNYLEIKVGDLSHYSIPRQFYSDYRKRMEQAAGEEKEIYRKMDSQAAGLKVSSFFGKTSDFWNEYNRISENMVHHYGLQIFESLISCYDGYFSVRSQEAENLQRETEFYTTHEKVSVSDYALPGTQYDILLPFRKRVRMQDLSLNVNINYTDGLLNEYQICKDEELMQGAFKTIYEEIKSSYPDISYQEQKEQIVRALADRLNYKIKKIPTENWILHFHAESIPMPRIELFCKAIMLNIAQKLPDQHFNMMITECTSSHFVEITRMMALFYNKQGINPLMVNTQIFMSGKDEKEEFLITGSNLGEAIGSTEKLAFARCTHPDCLRILKKMLVNHEMGVKPNEIVTIIPFDMIPYDSGKPTLLECRLKSVLNEDVQSTKFGCKLENLHVRIGSKIHIQTFFEAELLFHNNYYTSRFAYWLYNELRCDKGLDLQRPFVLVGCESYSEMLLNELCGMFDKSGIESEYLIYEERIAGKFRGKKTLDEYRDHQFIIIVPINSTLTTHIKVSGFLKKMICKKLKENGDSSFVTYDLPKVLNYGLVLIYEKEDNDYWYRVAEGKKVICSKINRKTMKYYIDVTAKWENPLECKACFPDDDYTKEIPMVETNKESIVPMHAIGIRKKASINVDEIGNDDEEIRDLSRFLVYRHVERNGNHFNYYFATEKLWNSPDIRNKIRKWLERKETELFGEEQCKVYDIIVAPLHYSNTVFVEEVNGSLFKNAALVLHFDADKEFRMNVQAKYSSIQQLYDNLCEDDDKSIINFHYVDDTIVSGRTFRRMKTLISSMICKREKPNVQVNIFKSIVLLLNRMSKSSIADYIEDQNYFLAYFNLKISSMRVNSDACVLCKKYAEWRKLAQQASLNKVFVYCQKKSKELECMPVEKIDAKETETPDRIKRNEQYMIASHRAKAVVDAVCSSMDNAEIQRVIVDKLFPEDVRESDDELIAMLKVLGRPFLSFRREEKEAVFGLMLTMLDTLLAETEPTGEDKLSTLLKHIWEKDDIRTKLIRILMNRLAELESNYIIRKRSMERIIEFSDNHINDLEERKGFVDNYLNRVKQLVGQSNDYAKGLFLEYLLLYGKEYKGNAAKSEIVSLCEKNSLSVFRKNVYLENTKLVNYGISYLADSFSDNMEFTKDDLVRVLNDNYYFDNFNQYLLFHQMITLDEDQNVQDFVSDTEYHKIEGMVHFELLYQKIFGENGTPVSLETPAGRQKPMAKSEIENTFTKMMKCLRDASGALDGEIIVPYENGQEVRKYIALELGTSTEIRGLENNEWDFWQYMDGNARFEEDTYAICNAPKSTNPDSKWIIIQFVNNATSERSDISVIYMLFPFQTDDENQLLHSLKNILIFRYKIWKILNLSSSTLLKNWTDNLFYKQQMLKSRATSHSEFDTLMIQFGKLSDQICDKYQDADSHYKDLYRLYFDLLIDSMIGTMNVKVLANRGAESNEQIQHEFMDFWEAQQQVVKAIEYTWNLKIEVPSKELETLKKYRIRCGTSKENDGKMFPSDEVLRLIFLAVLQSVKRHGQRDETGILKVAVSVKDEQICLSNNWEGNNIGQIKNAVSKESYRSKDGISQAVIYDICQSWYHDTRYETMFNYKVSDEGADEKAGENGGNECWYVVKLPIIERRDEHE